MLKYDQAQRKTVREPSIKDVRTKSPPPCSHWSTSSPRLWTSFLDSP